VSSVYMIRFDEARYTFFIRYLDCLLLQLLEIIPRESPVIGLPVSWHIIEYRV